MTNNLNPVFAWVPTNIGSYFSNFTAARMQAWTASVNATIAGTRDTRVLCIGDSLTYGTQDTGPAAYYRIGDYSYPASLVRQLQAYGLPAQFGFQTILNQNGTNGEQRTNTGNWAVTAAGSGGFCSTNLFGAAAGAQMIYTPGVLFDAVRVASLTVAPTTQLSVTVSGGSTVQTPATAMAISFPTVASGASASTANTVTVTNTTGGSRGYLVGIEPYLTTTKQVLIGNAGRHGSVSNNWSDPGTIGGLASIRATSPDLTIICLGHNTGNQSAQAYLSDVMAIAGAASESGSVIVMTPNAYHVGPGTQDGRLLQMYRDAILRNSPYPCIDMYARSSQYATLDYRGASDGSHFYASGYADEAMLISRAITQMWS